MTVERKPEILILGGGLAGVQVVRELERALSPEEAHLRLVCRDDFVLFTPMLYEVAASDLELATIIMPIREMMKRAQFIEADIENIDLDRKAVEIVHVIGGQRHVLTYDHLVLALGSVVDFHGISGLAQYALTIGSLEDAVKLRSRVVAHIKEASEESDPSSRNRLLTIVVAGGGLAGVETVAGLSGLLRSAVRSYPNLAPGMLRLILTHSGETLLPELSPDLGRHTEKRLRKGGIEVYMERNVTTVTSDGVTLDDGMFIPTRFLVWTAGTAPSPSLASLPIAKVKGRIPVTTMLELITHPGVWSFGDCSIVSEGTTGTYALTARHPLRQARTVAANIAATLRGKPLKKLSVDQAESETPSWWTNILLRLLTWRLSGSPVFWVWRAIYLGEMPDWEKRFLVIVEWMQGVLSLKRRRPILPNPATKARR